MTQRELIQQKAIELLANEAQGIRSSVLTSRINEILPSIKRNSVRGALVNILVAHPEQVYKPSYGLFRHINFKESNSDNTRRPENIVQETKDEEFYDSIGDWLNKEYGGRTGFNWQKCPIQVVKVKDRSALPSYVIRFITLIKDIKETKQFNEMVTAKDGNPHGQIRAKWKTTKRKLAISTRKFKLDFKKWTKDGEDNVFSVRVGKDWRAHMWLDKNTGDWYAIKFGTHKEMGHG